jgi:hypothetical protein
MVEEVKIAEAHQAVAHEEHVLALERHERL